MGAAWTSDLRKSVVGSFMQGMNIKSSLITSNTPLLTGWCTQTCNTVLATRLGFKETLISQALFNGRENDAEPSSAITTKRKKSRVSKFLLLLSPDHWLTCLNSDWFNTKVAAIPPLDHYKALIKSIHLPGNQFPVADAGIKSTHIHPAKAHVLLNPASGPVLLQPTAAAERARGCGHMVPSCRSGAEPRALLCSGQRVCTLCSHSHAGSLLLAN